MNLLTHEERTLVQMKGIPLVDVGDASTAGIAPLERFHRRGMSRIGPKDYLLRPHKFSNQDDDGRRSVSSGNSVPFWSGKVAGIDFSTDLVHTESALASK